MEMRDFLDVGIGMLSCVGKWPSRIQITFSCGNELADKVHAALVGASPRERGEASHFGPQADIDLAFAARRQTWRWRRAEATEHCFHSVLFLPL